MKAKKYGKLLAFACVTMLSVSAFTACSNDEADSSDSHNLDSENSSSYDLDANSSSSSGE